MEIFNHDKHKTAIHRFFSQFQSQCLLSTSMAVWSVKDERDRDARDKTIDYDTWAELEEAVSKTYHDQIQQNNKYFSSLWMADTITQITI